jgi:preprotein translocase subunit SecY
MAETGAFPLFDKLANIFRIPDLRKRVLFTLAMLAVYRLGGHLPTPGVNFLKLEEAFNRSGDRFSVSWICFPAAACAK